MQGIALSNQSSSQGRVSRGSRFLYLFLTQVLLLAVLPWLDKATWSSVLVRLVGGAALYFTVYAVSEKRAHWIIALALTIPAGILNATYALHPDPKIAIPTWLCTIASLLFSLVALLRAVIRTREITSDTIYGALSVYMLIGIVWGVCYILLETLQPGALAMDPTRHPQHQLDWFDCMFYSFVTLTTVGYGDMIPVSGPARSLSVLEAICGVMYVAILVARLVGLYSASRDRAYPEREFARQARANLSESGNI